MHEDIELAIQKNREALTKLIKYFHNANYKKNGKQNVVDAVKKYKPNFNVQMLHNWLNLKGCKGIPLEYCLIFEALTNGKYNVLNLRFDLDPKVRKLYADYKKALK